MQDEILKSRIIRLNIPQNKTFESYFEDIKSEETKVKIIPSTLDEPMEIIIRDIIKPQTFEGKTGTYIPPKADIKPLKRVKGHIVNRAIRKVLG